MSTILTNRDILSHIFIKQGYITAERTDAIVNAANTSLLGGGGVDGAIHRAAGPDLLRECETFGGCQPGEARITKGYRLPARFVIHTPGPIYRGGNSHEADILKNSYLNSLSLAREHALKSISFPAISTGVYHYPKEEACSVALGTVIEFMRETQYVLDVYFILFDNDNYSIYKNHLSRLQHELS